MTLKELEQQLLALSPSEKVQAIGLLAQSLGSTWQGIEKTPKVCGGEARIAKTRIPIWVLVEARRLGYSDSDLLLSYPTITAIDLANAWAYALAHPDEIKLAIDRGGGCLADGTLLHGRAISISSCGSVTYFRA